MANWYLESRRTGDGGVVHYKSLLRFSEVLATIKENIAGGLVTRVLDRGGEATESQLFQLAALGAVAFR